MHVLVEDPVIVRSGTGAIASTGESYDGKIGVVKEIITPTEKVHPLYPVFVKFDLSQFTNPEPTDSIAPFRFDQLALV